MRRFGVDVKIYPKSTCAQAQVRRFGVDTKRRAALFLLLFLIQSSCFAATFQSSSRKTLLLEVFSSEGCSSCPPADEWMSGLQKNPGLWKDFVPVIFHVDYWDKLGWKDRFSSGEYTQRQKRYVNSWGSSTLYTPGFVLGGKAWEGWYLSGNVPVSKERPGILKMVKNGSGRYEITFTPAAVSPVRLEAHAALLGFGIRSEVKSGENAGRTLHHDFIVLDYKHRVMNEKSFSASLELKPPGEIHYEKLGAAVWITRQEDPQPIQACGGYLSSSKPG